MSEQRLKHMARTLDLSPFRLRTLLRREYGHAPGKRWKWKSTDDPKYKKVLAKMRSICGIKDTTLSSSQPQVKSSHKGAGKP